MGPRPPRPPPPFQRAAPGRSKLNSSARSHGRSSAARQRRRTYATLIDLVVAPGPKSRRQLLRKEVIQPQVPLRLPCYDFTPVTDHSLGAYPPCGLAQPLLEQSTPMV